VQTNQCHEETTITPLVSVLSSPSRTTWLISSCFRKWKFQSLNTSRRHCIHNTQALVFACIRQKFPRHRQPRAWNGKPRRDCLQRRIISRIKFPGRRQLRIEHWFHRPFYCLEWYLGHISWSCCIWLHQHKPLLSIACDNCWKLCRS